MRSVFRSQRLPLIVTFLALLAWSVYAFATVRVNGDIVAEAIQVQRWIADPWWVWSYPGQRHGGVIEYPFIAIAELVSPGNVYGFTLIRVLYIPLVGLLLGISLHWAFPRWNLWPFAFAAAAGPAVLHGFRMISDIYPFGWLLSASGIVIAYGVWSGRIKGGRAPALVFAGFLVGLGIYEHASSAVLSVAMLAGGIAVWRLRLRGQIPLVIGILLGLIPMAIALFGQPDLPVVYSPANPGLPDLVAIFGLSTDEGAWRQALVPNGWGVMNADETLLGLPYPIQVAINAVVVIAVIGLVLPLVRWRRTRAHDKPRREPAVFIAVLWAAGLVTLLAISAVVNPVWYYASGLGFLVWITAAALPNMLNPRLGISLIAILILALGSVSIRAVLLAQPAFLEGARFKLGQARFNENIAADVKAAGVDYLYGDYWEVLPIAYTSAGELTPITFDTNRFPLPADLTGQSIVVGLTSGYLSNPLTLPRWLTAAKAEANVTDNCRERVDINLNMPDGVRAFECPVAVVVEPRL